MFQFTQFSTNHQHCIYTSAQVCINCYRALSKTKTPTLKGHRVEVIEGGLNPSASCPYSLPTEPGRGEHKLAHPTRAVLNALMLRFPGLHSTSLPPLNSEWGTLTAQTCLPGPPRSSLDRKAVPSGVSDRLGSSTEPFLEENELLGVAVNEQSSPTPSDL